MTAASPPSLVSIPLTETKCHNDSSTKIDSTKKAIMTILKLSANPTPAIALFPASWPEKCSEPPSTGHRHLHEDRNSKRGYLAPEQHFVVLRLACQRVPWTTWRKAEEISKPTLIAESETTFQIMRENHKAAKIFANKLSANATNCW